MSHPAESVSRRELPQNGAHTTGNRLSAIEAYSSQVTSISVVAVKRVPTPEAGMASGATSMQRDFDLTAGQRSSAPSP
jgi:hypothetical protein